MIRQLIRQFKLNNRDPNILPLKARTTLAVAGLSTTFFIILSKDIGISHALTGFRIVLAVFGALVTYWATAAKEQDLQRVANEFAKFSSTKLSFQDIISVIVIHYMAIIMCLLNCALAVLTATYQPDHLRLPVVLCIGILFLFFASVPTGQYALIKLTRWWCNHWRQRIGASQDQYAEIRSFLRLIGVTSVVLSLFAQLPAIFV
jgi:hypothetical protein